MTSQKNFFDEQSEEFLFLFGVEVVDHGGDSCGESLDSAADPVVVAEFSSLGGEVVAAAGELGAAVFEIGGAALHLGECEQPGLVEFREASAFVVGCGDLAVEACQFRAESSSSGARVRAATACSPADGLFEAGV